MKNTFLFFFTFLALSFVSQDKVKSQSKTINEIRLNIENIPKIQHKITTSKTSWRTDKSPTLSYRLENDVTDYPIELKKGQKSITLTLDHDVVYLRVRYNPGKIQYYILRRGDDVFIEYSNGKPYIDVLNRKMREYDADVSEFIDQFEFPMSFWKFYQQHKRFPNAKEREEDTKQYIQIYDQQLAIIDSLHMNNLLSQLEYEYHRNSILYQKLNTAKKFDISLLKMKLLHIPNFNYFLNTYIHSNLKKKTISLGNGMAQNWDESFEISYSDEHLSKKNKKYLLERFLKEIKIDYPKSKYNARVAQYESAFKDQEKKENLLDHNGSIGNLKSPASLLESNSKKLTSIYPLTNEVNLSDSKGNLTTLKEVLDSNKGKIVYIDFWASWCEPCRAAFPSYADLKKEYRKKDIVFIFISGDKDPDKWKQAEIKEQLTNSYLAINYPDAKFYQDLILKSFPRYLVFDKQGQLLKQRAPAPDSDHIRGFINEWVSK